MGPKIIAGRFVDHFHSDESLTVMPSVKAFVFDLDGTLVDTLGGISNAINCAFELHGLDSLSINEIAGLVGKGGTALVEYGLKKNRLEPDSERVAQIQDSYFQMYLAAPIHNTKVMPGVIPMLERATVRGLSLSICTNKTGVLAAAILDELGLTQYFRHLVFGDSVPFRKPHPEPIRLILEQLGFPPEVCVMIGDTENDMCAARRAGVRSVFVDFGYSRLESLVSQPDWIINHFDQLDSIFLSIGCNASSM